MSDGQPRLLDQIRGRNRRKHYSIWTEERTWTGSGASCYITRRVTPGTWGRRRVKASLTHLAVAKRVSASTQNQAKSAVVFLYKEVLGGPVPWLEGIESAKGTARLPVVLTREEVKSIPAHLSGAVGLMIRLFYGTGMKIMECVRLRVNDVDFARGEIAVRQGKGAKDRMACAAAEPVPLKDHLGKVKKLHEEQGGPRGGEPILQSPATILRSPADHVPRFPRPDVQHPNARRLAGRIPPR